MDFPDLHPWDVTPSRAVALQKELAGRVDASTPLGPYRTVAGADVSYNKYDEVLYAAVVVLSAGTLELVERVGVAGPATFPYVPGLLSFREAPALLDAFRRLKARPDVVMCDGQGIAHPRRLGIASHLGLWLGLPAVGCAKSWLFGQFDEPGPDRGSLSPLTDKGDPLGAVVRTRSRVQPVYVSPGHLCDVPGAVRLVLETSSRVRLPTPTRSAHDYVNVVRRAATAGLPIPE